MYIDIYNTDLFNNLVAIIFQYSIIYTTCVPIDMMTRHCLPEQ